jgi:hypothetical protein
MAGENEAFVCFVRRQKCRLWMQDPCEGPTEPHHAGERGLGQRAHDETCIPLCTKHHRAFHDASGLFKRWRRDERRAWLARQIQWTQHCWENQEPHDDAF